MNNLVKAAAIAALFTLLTGSLAAQSPIPPTCPPGGCGSGGHLLLIPIPVDQQSPIPPTCPPDGCKSGPE